MLSEDMKEVNHIILDRMHSDVPMIPQLASHLIAAGGKRIRPLMTIAIANMFGYAGNRHHKISACVEFIHTATLLHDDVIDESEKRRGRETANRIFGNEAAVLVGDFLFSRAFQLMVEDGNLEVLKTLSDASAVIAEGEIMQLTTCNNLDTTVEKYMEVIEAKTAALFSAACKTGAIIADCTEQEKQDMHDYGLNLGISFQIMDDSLDYNADQEKLGKSIGDDFKEGKMTLPVILAYQESNPEEKEFWQRVIKDSKQESSDFEIALAIINKYNILDKCQNYSLKYHNKALNNINKHKKNELNELMSSLVSYVVNREN